MTYFILWFGKMHTSLRGSNYLKRVVKLLLSKDLAPTQCVAKVRMTLSEVCCSCFYLKRKKSGYLLGIQKKKKRERDFMSLGKYEGKAICLF